MDTDNITIYEKDLLSAQRICASIIDTDRRNKAVANVIAAKIAAGFFDPVAYELDTQTGLHNIAALSEKYELSDIYVNEAFIDVRVYFSDDELCVPKIHFDTGILPTAYMFVQLSPDLKNAAVKGFIYPESIDKNKVNDNVYVLTANELCSFYDIETRLKKPDKISILEDAQLYELIEGSLDEQEEIELFKKLVSSKYLRNKLVKAIRAQSAFNLISIQTIKEKQLNDSIPNSELLEPETEEVDLTDEDLDSLFAYNEDETHNADTSSNEDFSTEVTPSGADVIEILNSENSVNENNSSENSEQIETLFSEEQEETEEIPVTDKKKKNSFIPVLVTALIISVAAYYGYSYKNSSSNKDIIEAQQIVTDENIGIEDENNLTNEQTEVKNDAMPVETVEGNTINANKEESTAVAIPAIERSLDASILVSNLKVDWEVPEGYAASTSAKRYLIKLGKIIQLNLKTELLLLNKPPLSNTITVELQYDSNIGKFNAVAIQQSSGEKTVDDTIFKTVQNVVRSNNIQANREALTKLQGNPVLIIHL